MDGHRARVGCMAWSSHLLSTGSRDKTILQRDVRAPEHWTSRLAAHRSEVRSCILPAADQTLTSCSCAVARKAPAEGWPAARAGLPSDWFGCSGAVPAAWPSNGRPRYGHA
jgi:WD40 repeat protein